MKNIHDTNDFVVGVDVGGSHISACCVDIHAGEIHHHTLVHLTVDSKGKPEDILDRWAEAILTSVQMTGMPVRSVGMALPGPFDYEKGISYIRGLGKYEQLYGCHVKNELSKRLLIQPEHIRMKNDATCFLMGERAFGKAKQIDNVVGITLGTGLGSCWFHDGRIEDGDLWCFLYEGSHAEDRVSTRWLLEQYENACGQRALDVKEIAEKAKTDPRAAAIFHAYGKSLGEVIGLRYAGDYPEKVVFGGGITNIWQLFAPSMAAAIGSFGTQIELEVSGLLEISAMAGAAMLWSESITT
jgi:glucokinase